jgi:carbamoyltransferase
MILTAQVLPEKRSVIPSVTLIMNNSFKLRGEAILHTPTNALRTFFSSGMDALVIGSFLIEK